MGGDGVSSRCSVVTKDVYLYCYDCCCCFC